MYEAGAVGHLAVNVSLRVIGPQFAPGSRIERHHSVVGRTEIHHPADDNGRSLEFPRRGAILSQWLLAGLPSPCELEMLHIRGVDIGECRESRRGLIGAVERPVLIRLYTCSRGEA